MLRKALGGAAVAGAAGMLVAGAASPASAADYDQADAGGVNVLSNICLGNWSGSALEVLNIANSDLNATCNGWDQNADGVNVASNICALNWDWQGGILSAGQIANLDNHFMCNWSDEEIDKLQGHAE